LHQNASEGAEVSEVEILLRNKIIELEATIKMMEARLKDCEAATAALAQTVVLLKMKAGV
jgi:BMFP domain-containing protein YqiC